MNLKELARKAVSTLFLSMLCLVAFAQTATGLVKDKTGVPERISGTGRRL